MTLRATPTGGGEPTTRRPAPVLGPSVPGAPMHLWRPIDPQPDAGASRTEPVDVTHVSTTGVGARPGPVTAHGTGRPSPATVHVRDGGVVVDGPTGRDVAIPRASLRAVEVVRGEAGEMVGVEGVVVVRWESMPGDRDGPPLYSDTCLRPRHPADRDRLATAVRGLLKPPAVPPTPQPEEKP
ncbi:PH-like domain-containing protein [Actinotalea solisilvae]|uniref:PH-like domain-containing protein n=1 Tax=Actinotalea solisilvae TaxID=2072922 RepID=UPI0018F13AB3|nr:hypothetical protein [Actinotalea solisilvae]